MSLENLFNSFADTNVFRLNRSRFPSVIVAAAWEAQNRANTADTMAGALVDIS
jgi:hypothetical protein